MRCIHVASAGAKVCLVALVAVFLAVPVVRAQEVKGSQIKVYVCPTAVQSNITITRPASDSVVSQPKVKVAGSVESISQIDFYIDDAYNNTLAVGGGDQTYESELSLAPGTHTIKLVAWDSCSQVAHEASIVITYQPEVVPGPGTGTDTRIDEGKSGRPDAEGSTSGGNNQQSGTGTSQSDRAVTGNTSPQIGFIEGILRDLQEGLGISSPMSLPDTVKASTAVAGVLTATVLPVLAEKGLLLPLQSQLSSLTGHTTGNSTTTHRTRLAGGHHWRMRGVGLLLMLIPFLV